MVRNRHRLVLRNKISKAKDLLPLPTAEITEEARTKLEAEEKLTEGRRTTLETLHSEILEHCDIDLVEQGIVEHRKVESEIEEIIYLMQGRIQQ